MMKNNDNAYTFHSNSQPASVKGFERKLSSSASLRKEKVSSGRSGEQSSIFGGTKSEGTGSILQSQAKFLNFINRQQSDISLKLRGAYENQIKEEQQKTHHVWKSTSRTR